MVRSFAASGMRLFAAVVLFGLTMGIALGVTLSVMPTGANHSGDGAVHVCANNSTGAMREVSNPNHCRSYEHEVELISPDASGFKFVDQESIVVGMGAGSTTTHSCFSPNHVAIAGFSTNPMIQPVGIDPNVRNSPGIQFENFSAVNENAGLHILCARQ